MLERDIIYRKDHKENMKLFRDVKTHKQYSIYATELNRVFGDRTYDQFYKGLLENKKIRINNFQKMFEKPTVKGGIKKIEDPFDIKLFTNCLKKMEIKSKELDYKLKHPHVINTSHYKYYKYNKEMEKLKNPESKIILPEIPDIGRYNPNYDAIRTHSFYPIFASSDFDNFNKYKKNVYAHQTLVGKEQNESLIDLSRNNNNFINYKNNVKTKILSDHYNTEGNIKINDKKNNSIIQKQKSIKSTNDFNLSQLMSTSSFRDEKNNHCLRFDSYSPRKPMINKILYNTEISNNSTNYNSFKNVKGNVDFNKSSNSNFTSYFDEIAKNSNNPPLGMYQPNYDYISKKTVNIFLNKRESPSPKLVKLKKIITDYNITSEYKMVTDLNNVKQPKIELDNVK